VPGSEHCGHKSALTFHHGAKLGVEPSLGAPDGLSLLSSGGIAAELVELDVGAVDKTQASRRLTRKQAEYCLP